MNLQFSAGGCVVDEKLPNYAVSDLTDFEVLSIVSKAIACICFHIQREQVWILKNVST